ncbi:protein Hook homolog 3 isoform X2 [Kryptolebias marmoratus]|uniref:protein Hook homolog 3 isoform X2 n=1 Tax=Kryptolebias marmoratus TaxID=37003 RepID=UPI0007F88F59|nr:protein Hook homolog 3 isoform X2 [Kryptolebias marmoratus]
MRRFFRAHRDEDYSQIQYLTAKCTRLAHDKVLEREFLVSGEKERKLQNDLEAATSRLLRQEHLNLELRIHQDQLVRRIQQQQDLVDVLRQRVVLLAEETSGDAELLRRVSSELLCLQSSEVKLEVLVEELHAEAQRRAAAVEGLQTELRAEAHRRAALTESLQAELRSKTLELEELKEANRVLTEELRDLHRNHQQEVQALRQQNDGSLRKLQQTADQLEWFCQQQRSWMSCVKRFKDGLTEERDALLRRVGVLEDEVEKQKVVSRDGGTTKGLACPLQAADSLTSWDADAVSGLESRYEELVNQTGSPLSRYQKPP